MIKMTSERPLLVDGEAKTEFETNAQHARELEAAGLAARVPSTALATLEPAEFMETPPVQAPEPVSAAELSPASATKAKKAR